MNNMKQPGDWVTAELTQAELVAGLARLGAKPTCRLMVHASLSRFGHVEGGAATVVAALRAAAGEGGAVIVPSFRDAIRADDYAMRECRAVCPRALCPSREPGHTGVVGETVRQQPDALRRFHPTHSWVGVGGDARFLLEGHCESPTPCGRESPFFRLMQRDGLVLLLGVGQNKEVAPQGHPPAFWSNRRMAASSSPLGLFRRASFRIILASPFAF